MSATSNAVVLAVQVHPRGGAPSGDEAAVTALRSAAASVGRGSPELVSGPSSVSPDGVLLLPLSEAGCIIDAVLAMAGELRPLGTSFCAAVPAGAAGPPSGRVESAVLAAEEASARALHGIESADAREHRVRLLVPDPDPVAEALAGMVLACYDAMTERQRQIVALTKRSDTQQRVAKHLDVTRQAVNQSLAAAGWPHLRRAEEAVRRHLSQRAPAAVPE